MIVQTTLVITTLVAMYLVSSPDRKYRAMAGLAGLLGVPAWLLSSYNTGQWGVFVLSLFIGYSWWLVYKNNKGADIGQASREDKM